MEVRIEDLAFGGDGVARPGGKVCFVPLTIPGEQCLISVRESRRNFMRAGLVKVLLPAPERVKPKCSVFGKCGGCQYQHMTYEAECRFKENQVRQLMIRLGGLETPPILPLLPSPQPYGYRNRVQLHVENGEFGFRSAGDQTLVPIRQCPIASDQINARIQVLSQSKVSDRGKINLSDDDTAEVGFSQVNRFQNEVLQAGVFRALGNARGRLIELYAGAGFFTRALAPQFKSVSAVEWDSRLVERARRWCPDHVKWIHQSVEDAVAELNWKSDPQQTLCILVDPPREGLSSPVLEAIRSSSAQRLVYLSCNPATQARDLKQLSPLWKVIEITPIDLFPRTAHIETLAVCVPDGQKSGRVKTLRNKDENAPFKSKGAFQPT